MKKTMKLNLAIIIVVSVLFLGVGSTFIEAIDNAPAIRDKLINSSNISDDITPKTKFTRTLSDSMLIGGNGTFHTGITGITGMK